MSRRKKNFFRLHGFTCLAGLSLLLAMKYYYSQADCDGLLWILAPTAWWVQILSGIPFEYLPHAGYVSHSFRFLIAASCSGVQFWIIAAALLLFSFLPGFRTRRGGFAWLAVSFISSYFFTVLVNGFRILVSLYLPVYLSETGFFETSAGWMSPDRLHIIIGVTVYFGSLLMLFFITESLFQRSGWSLSHPSPAPASGRAAYSFCAIEPDKCFVSFSQQLLWNLRWLLPAFWYLAIVLGLPLLNRAYQQNHQAFIEYALTILPVCIILLALIFVFRLTTKAVFQKLFF